MVKRSLHRDRMRAIYHAHWEGAAKYGEKAQLRLWFGRKLLKYPDDIMAYQMILVATKPDLLIETGTWEGASALFFAHMFDLIGHGRVLSIDIQPRASYLVKHPRITYLTESSVSPATADTVADMAQGKRCMVTLDSQHDYEHVMKELALYHPCVSAGCYLVVEDTNLNGHPIRGSFGPGPYEAVESFLEEHGDIFEQPPEWNDRILTTSPGGWLRRIT